MIVWICMLLALLAGLVSGIQGPANGALARAWDLPRSILLNGAIVCTGALIIFLLFRRPIQRIPPVPWTQTVGGLCGLFIIVVAAFSVPRIGAAVFTTVLFLGMATSSLLVDHYGWYGQSVVAITPLKIAGVLMIVGGVALVRWSG